MKRALIILIGVLLLVGCASKEKTETTEVTSSNIITDNENDGLPTEDAIQAFALSNPENDTDLGLKNIKIDNADLNLTEEQKTVLSYFDNDYMDIYEYELLQRYPTVFENSQVEISGYVEKILSYEDEYEILLRVMMNESRFFYRSLDTIEDWNNYVEENKNNYIVIKGKASDVRLIVGDYVEVYGRYTEISPYTIDGISYHLPRINVFRSYINEEFTKAVKFDYSQIKLVAKAVFGDDISIKKPVFEKDFIWSNTEGDNPFYICELDNQSNAKFNAFRLFANTGVIEDANTRSNVFQRNDEIYSDKAVSRSIEFSADFEHFFIFSYDSDFENLTLEYYDKELNKIWTREFEETTRALYDYTKNNVYLVVNNSLYIINAETGEDVFKPKFVGEKKGIRKLEDGILLVSSEKSDAIIKTDLSGDIIWSVNTKESVNLRGIQIVDGNIIIESYNNGYIVIDEASGDLLIEVN